MNLSDLERDYEKVVSKYLQERDKREWTLKEILSKVFDNRISDRLLEELEVIYERNSANVEPYPATKLVIPKLLETFELGIISNCPYKASAVGYELQKNNLAYHFRAITTSGDVGYRKPDSRIYLTALERVNASPENSLFVYHEEPEGEGARNVGMKTELIEGKNLERLLEVIGEHG